MFRDMAAGDGGEVGVGAMPVSAGLLQPKTVWLQVAGVSHLGLTLQTRSLGVPSLLKTSGGQSVLGAAPARNSLQVTHTHQQLHSRLAVLSLLYKVFCLCMLACPAAAEEELVW